MNHVLRKKKLIFLVHLVYVSNRLLYVLDLSRTADGE